MNFNMDNDNSQGYLTAHLEGTKSGLGYTRSAYAVKAWNTYGEFFPSERSSRICEIGPGQCELIEFVRDEHGFDNTLVVDVSDEVIDVAQRLGVEAHVTDDTVSWFAERNGQFDRVVMLHVLEHVEKQTIIALLSAIRTSLSDTGKLMLEVPNMGDPLNGTYYRYGDFTHEVGFTEESMRYVLLQAGFGEVTFIDAVGATSPLGRRVQRLARAVLKGVLFAVNLPNGRQMRRRLGPVLAVVAAS